MPIASRRSITSVRLQVQFALERGLSVAQCLAGSGLSEAMLSGVDCEISADQELAVVRNLCTLPGDNAELGLAMGQRYHLSSYGVWGFAMLSSSTFGQAVDLGLRYLDLTFAFVAMSLKTRGEQASLVLDDGALPAQVRPYLLARDASAIMVIQQELFAGMMPLSELCLRMPARDPAPFERIFGCQPQFGAAENRASFQAGLLAMPLPRANRATARLCEEQCQQLLMQRARRKGVAVQVRQRLLEQPGRFPDMEEMAAGLNVTSRTLRRQLAREGTGYRELLDEVRLMLAEQWLLAGVLRLEEISERLGFSEVSNFIHAFRRWTGQSPASYRRQQA
ncbi:AraC family transcriptional regulator [Alcanivorax hongdengensis A-11-3]|uniref:AraC family transcriptional regulator n=1 Tax=Alcanivorax hongdengensis A-11-3 TaxID=1177179 RepID=L0WI57_9GAMM|nr:AraC family transcriptional regulator [Alcanivorax hongdengensis]EKF75842.1 AraC family transcriptional regulator [Alcanivorax hongdengensis A-11-3]